MSNIAFIASDSQSAQESLVVLEKVLQLETLMMILLGDLLMEIDMLDQTLKMVLV